MFYVARLSGILDMGHVVWGLGFLFGDTIMPAIEGLDYILLLGKVSYSHNVILLFSTT